MGLALGGILFGGLGAAALFVIPFVLIKEKRRSAALAAHYRKLQVIPAAPATPKDGRVVFHGRVETDTPKTEPIVGDPCVWYQSTGFVRRRVQSEKRSYWKYLKRVPTHGQTAFWIRDDTGRVLCDGEKLQVGKVPFDEDRDWSSDEVPPAIRSALTKLGIDFKRRWFSSGKWRLGYTRRMLKAGDLVFAYAGAELPNHPYRSASEYRLTPVPNFPITITTKSPQELTAHHQSIAASNVPIWLSSVMGLLFLVVGSVMVAVGIGTF